MRKSTGLSGSLDLIDIRSRGCSSQVQKAPDHENFLKWLAFSSNSISFLPVFLASDSTTESDFRQRTSTVDILSPCYLNHLVSGVPEASQRAQDMLPSPAPAAEGLRFSHASSEDAFGATLLWEKIVTHLERNVKCGRHARGLRTFGTCFLGSKAVECLSAYLNTILPKTTNREQVSILCQKLLVTGVMEEVRSKDETVFRENKLYRFTGYHFWHSTESSSAIEGATRCRSAEPPKPSPSPDLLQPTLRTGAAGYDSDSTLISSSHVRARRLTTRRSGILSPKGPIAKHQTSRPVAQQPTTKSHKTSSPLVTAWPWTHFSLPRLEKLAGRLHPHKQDKPAEIKSTARATATRDTAPLRRERHRAIRQDPRLNGHHKLLSDQTVDALDRRHSLQLREAGSNKRDSLRQTMQDDKLQLRGIHRSHSFCSITSRDHPQWKVYGYV